MQFSTKKCNGTQCLRYTGWNENAKFYINFIDAKIFAKCDQKYSFSQKDSQKSPNFFCFRENFRQYNLNFWKPANFFILLAASLVPVLHIFSRKPPGKQKITRKQIVPQKPAKISCRKYCYNSGLIISHVAANFALFVISLIKVNIC